MNEAKNIFPCRYSVTISVPANGAGSDVIIFDPVADFEYWLLQGSSDQDVPTDIYNNNFTLQIRDTTTGRDFFSVVQPQVLAVGPGNRNVPEFRPVTFPGSTRLQIQVQDLSGNDSEITITLVGYKIFIR